MQTDGFFNTLVEGCIVLHKKNRKGLGPEITLFHIYRKVSNIRRTLVGNKIVDH